MNFSDGITRVRFAANLAFPVFSDDSDTRSVGTEFSLGEVRLLHYDFFLFLVGQRLTAPTTKLAARGGVTAAMGTHLVRDFVTRNPDISYSSLSLSLTGCNGITSLYLR